MVRGLAALVALVGLAGAAVLGAWLLAEDALAVAMERGAHGGLAGLLTLPFADALLALCATVLLGSVGWLLITASLTAVVHLAAEVVPHSRSVRRLCRATERTCPRPVRQVVAAVLGAALSTGMASAPAAAVAGRSPSVDRGDDRVTSRPDTDRAPAILPAGLTGLPLPDRTTGSRPPSPAAQPHKGPQGTASVRVRPGQSLWSIAEGLLGAPATDREISHGWQRLHRANSGRIGPDPDLILPGTRLVVPDLTVHHREEPP